MELQAPDPLGGPERAGRDPDAEGVQQDDQLRSVSLGEGPAGQGLQVRDGHGLEATAWRGRESSQRLQPQRRLDRARPPHLVDQEVPHPRAARAPPLEDPEAPPALRGAQLVPALEEGRRVVEPAAREGARADQRSPEALGLATRRAGVKSLAAIIEAV